MKKGQNLKWILGAMWLTLGSAMLAQPGWAQATTPVEDKVVKTSIYFPMPHVSYNTLYLGKKLDIGISQSFRADLGSENCDGASTLVGTGAELPSLWLPDQDPSGNAIDPTPLLLRNQLPNGTALQGRLDITGLAAPILVKEVEVGTRSHNGTAGAAQSADAYGSRSSGNGSYYASHDMSELTGSHTSAPSDEPRRTSAGPDIPEFMMKRNTAAHRHTRAQDFKDDLAVHDSGEERREREAKNAAIDAAVREARGSGHTVDVSGKASGGRRRKKKHRR